MNEYLASVLAAEKMNRYEDAHCPRNYCRHEYRDEQQFRKPFLFKKV